MWLVVFVFERTDGYLRYIPTDGRMTVSFFSGCNLINEDRNPPKNIAHNFNFSKYEIWWHSRTPDCFFYRQHKTQNTKHTDTTTSKISHATLPSSSFAPSLSIGRAVVLPNHGATAPQRHAQAASRRGCARCCWFACLGRQNKRHWIIERGGVP